MSLGWSAQAWGAWHGRSRSTHSAAGCSRSTGRTRSDSMTCETCGGPIGKGEDCPECQVTAAEMMDACCETGARIVVTLPPDVAPWWDEEAFGATWEATVVGVNGDSLDVTTPTGDVEPVDVEYCRPWTCSAEASPAKTCLSLGFPAVKDSEQGSMAQSRGSGASSPASSENPAPDGSSSKTSPCSCPTDSTASSQTLTASGSMRSGRYSTRHLSERPTFGRACSWWPGTPVRVDPGLGHPSRSSSAMLGVLLSPSADGFRVCSLEGDVVTVPEADLLALWPTPTRREGNNTGGAAQFERNALGLNALVHGAVHPLLVEWMMGFPTGWTELRPAVMQLRLFAPSSSGRAS